MHRDAGLINRENRAEKLPKGLNQPCIFRLKDPFFPFLFLLYLTRHKNMQNVVFRMRFISTLWVGEGGMRTDPFH